MLLRTALIGLFIFSTVSITIGQSNPTPTPTTYRTRQETALERIRRQDREHERIAQEAYNNLYGQGSYANSPRFNGTWRKRMVSLYRKPKDSELKALEPAERFRKEYASLLKQKNTGLFVIRPDQGCPSNGEIVSASKACKSFSIPGSGSSYSFRNGSYRIRRLADISYVKKSLFSSGFFASSVFGVLGDIPIDEVGLESPGVPFLASIKASSKPKEAMDLSKRFARGVKKDGYLYGRGVFATPETTFIMRSIAYRGKFMRSELGVSYNELDFDKRRDVLVAFRIVEVANDGTATIVWKILRSEKSPKMKIAKK